IVAPIASSPFTCWSTGRAPIAQPPGSETLAWPQRASSGPSTSTDARMVFTSSYAAVGSLMAFACSTMPPSARSTPTPIWPSSFAMVDTSRSRGRLERRSGRSVSSAAHMIGSAAFFAPEMRISPLSGRPPVILSLSMVLFYPPIVAELWRAAGVFPFLGREGLHRERMDLFAHPVPERGVHQLVALHPAASGELRGHDQGLEMLAVARHF